MLELPVPDVEYENEVLKPSDYQKDMVSDLAERAERVRNRRVDPSVDNMLKITNDGRKLALDQRLINDILPDEEQSKAAVCVENAFKIWEETKDERLTQLIFCDLSTPKGDGKFNVYEDIRDKLIEKGVPAEEIAFISLGKHGDKESGAVCKGTKRSGSLSPRLDAENGSGNERAGQARGTAPSGCAVETVRHRAAGGAYSETGQSE